MFIKFFECEKFWFVYIFQLSFKPVISNQVQGIIAQGVITWKIDTDWNYLSPIFVGSPLLAHFPPYYLFNSPGSVITKL